MLCQLPFPSVQAATFSWFQSLFQQIIQDMKKGVKSDTGDGIQSSTGHT